MNPDFTAYNNEQEPDRKVICELLADEVHKNLPDAESKVWHGAPVWFINGNPIVGYTNRKNYVTLLFWSGQSFDEPGLKPEGSFKAAEANFTSPDEINAADIARWIEKAKKIQWDYKNIVKNRGVLDRLA
jgi:hypothetical protein